MGTSIRRTTIWLVLAALSIAAAAWMTVGVSADASAPAPKDGRLKIIKERGGGIGGWPAGAFIFNWSCNTDPAHTGNVTFPDDFTGAQFDTGVEYPAGTTCTVEEKNGTLSVSDYSVTTQIEAGGGFAAINPRNIDINNASGQNTIKFKNTELEPKQVRIEKNVVDFPGQPPDFVFDISCDMGGYFQTVAVAGGSQETINLPADTIQCQVTETGVAGGSLGDWATTFGTPPTDGLVFFQVLDTDDVTVFEFTNTWNPPQPKDATIWVNKEFSGPEDWKFGFAFACEGFGNADTFVLGGGDSAHFEIPFYETDVLFVEENGNGEEHGILCGVAEELLVADWTVNVSVSGTDEFDTGPTEVFGGLALFAVYPGDAITVTFENIAGYLVQPPSGISPVIIGTDPS